jgi:hypothetical protein
VLFKALDFGIDISIQAGTKYLIGHSDAMVGTAVSNARCWAQLRENAYLMGQMVDADTAYMTSRGLRTWASACVSIMKAACASPNGWRSIRRWRASTTPPCPAAKAMSSGSAILPAAAGCSRLCSINA